MAMERDNDPGYEGLRILARMIARVYLDELAEERLAARNAKQNEENGNADQGSKRDYQVTETGKDPARD